MNDELKRRLALIFGFVFIDLLGYSLILPLLPYYAETFGASATIIGLLGTVNAIGKLIAAPAVGRLSDRYGRRPLLIVSIVGTVVSFVLLGAAQSLFVLFLSRVLDGVLGGNIALARAYITDVTDEENRARGLGIIGAAFGIGFVIGPFMGGVLSSIGGYDFPAYVAAGLSLLNLIAVVLWLPESLTTEAKAKLRNSPKTRFSFRMLVETLRQPCVGPLFHIRLVYALAFTLFQANFSLYAKNHLGLTAQTTSYVLAYVGLSAALVQGVVIGKLTDRFQERPLIFTGTLIMAGALLIWAFVPNVWLLLVVLAPIALAGGILNTVLSSQLTKVVPPEETGGTLGLSASMQTLAQIVAPLTGGALIGNVGTWSVGVLGAALMAWTASYAQRYLLNKPEVYENCRARPGNTVTAPAEA